MLANGIRLVAVLVLAGVGAGCAGNGAGRQDVAPAGTATASSGRSIEGRQLEANGRVSTVEEMLQGRFPGVRVLRTPEGLRVQVRGPSTLSGRGDPLYVVDGMPLQNSVLHGVVPSEIAKIEVLTGADAAFYGMRGTNGVIVITTKRPGR